MLSDGFASRNQSDDNITLASQAQNSPIHKLTDPVEMLSVGTALHNTIRGAGTVTQISRPEQQTEPLPSIKWAIAYADSNKKSEEWFTKEELLAEGEAGQIWVFNYDDSDDYQAFMTRNLIAETVARAEGLERGTSAFQRQMTMHVHTAKIESGCLRSKSLFCIPADSALRRLTHRILTNNAFEASVILAICFSSLLVAISNPATEDPTWMLTCDWVLTIFFVAEMLLKIVDMGLVLDKHAYLRDYWNLLDSAVVILSVWTLIFQEARSLRTLRAFRSLRPLRLISRAPGLRITVNCILGCLKPCCSVVVLCGLVSLIMAWLKII